MCLPCVIPLRCRRLLTDSITVFSIGLLYGSGRPNGDYFAGLAAIFVNAYTASTSAFNILVTGLICGRIIYIGRCMRGHYGADTQIYTGTVAIVVESALPFTIFSIVYLITYAIGTDIAYAFSFYAMFTVSNLHIFATWSLC